MSRNSINFKAGSYIEGGTIVSPSNIVTVSFFIKGDMANANSRHTVLGFNDGRYNLYLMNDTIKGFGFNTWSSDIRGISDVSKILDNKVHHILAVFTSNTVTDELWIDGKQQPISLITGTENTENMTVNNTKLFISRGYSLSTANYNGQHFNGNIDDISIWDGKVSVEEALSQKGKVGNKIVYYNMDNMSNSNNVTELVSKLSYSIVGSTWSWDKELGVFNYLAIKNPTTNEHYSLAENTLIHMPDNSTKNMILHGTQQGKEIQLDVPFTKHNYINESSVANVSGKMFTQDVGKINTLNIKEVRDSNSFKPVFTWYETKMTSNTAPSPYVASASSEYVSQVGGGIFSAYLAFNGQMKTTAPLDCWATSNNINTGHLQIDFGKPIEINVYSISTRGEKTTAQFAFTSAPKSWKLKASNDSVSFDVIHEVSNETSWSENSSEKFFTLPKQVSYRFYRLNVTQNNGNAYYLAIGQLKFGKREVN